MRALFCLASQISSSGMSASFASTVGGFAFGSSVRTISVVLSVITLPGFVYVINQIITWRTIGNQEPVGGAKKPSGKSRAQQVLTDGRLNRGALRNLYLSQAAS